MANDLPISALTPLPLPALGSEQIPLAIAGLNYRVSLSSILGAIAGSANIVTATLAAGSQDFGTSPPVGYVPGQTGVLNLTANAAGSVLNGLAAGGAIVLFNNGSVNGNIQLPHRTAGNAANQWNVAGGAGNSVFLLPFQSVLAITVSGYGWIFI